jgi:uncharacterized beta-barrel protein YwiB (DUF1934 family)
MKRKVCIDIKATQSAEEQSDTTELFTVGTYTKGKTPDSWGIRYEESDATGFAGNVVTLNVCGNDIVVMNRLGDAPSSLVIERGKKHHCHYGTPHGGFMIGITADEIRSELSDRGGRLYLKYTVDINSGFMCENEMFIDIKESNTHEQQ